MPPQQKLQGPSLPVGIPQELNTRLKHLATLLKNLPSSIPLDPSQSSYAFSLDPDDVKDEGHAYAFNPALELAFQTHKLRDTQLLFTERGKRLVALEKFIAQFPLPEVVKDALGLDMPANQLPSSGGFCVDSTTVQAAENGSLRGCGEAENIWAYNEEGVPWRAEDLVGEASQM
ncbi:hypothetical protein B0H14DRAFT_2571874 [Mycena olivaceomarginata]|nr:hypothetical protein B0H14DRAFT_2571874 [Mycena olivaceomarginata]